MKKWSLAHFCAYLSLAVSVTLLVLWCCNVGGFTVVSLDSFVGVIVALLAIVVTLAVGWQIFNIVDINDKIKKLNVLEEKFNEQEETIGLQTKKSQHLISLLFGLEAHKEKNYVEAFRYYMASLRCSMLLNKPLNVDKLLALNRRIANKIEKGSTCDLEKLNEIREYDKSIRLSQCYDIIKNQYEEIFNTFKSKVNDKHD